MKGNKLEREAKTIELMLNIYCGKLHGEPSGTLCSSCQALLEYALHRLAKCPFKEHKPACKKCNIHCYKAHYREEIKKVMRFAGPRMLIYHPWYTFSHYFLSR